MFALIISILAIILAIAIAAISIYYGGDAFSNNKVKADATAIINQAQQIEAAMTLYNSKNKGDLVVGGRTSDSGLFDYLTAGDYLKNTPDGNGGTWELRCSDSAFQSLFEAGVDGDPATADEGQDDPSSCGTDGVVLTLSGVTGEQCNVINVLQNYAYQSDEYDLDADGSVGADGVFEETAPDSGVFTYNPAVGETVLSVRTGVSATEDGYVPNCSVEPNAPCCDG